jgi:hypothetical protein
MQESKMEYADVYDYESFDGSFDFEPDETPEVTFDELDYDERASIEAMLRDNQ